jgi:hypothetical protein
VSACLEETKTKTKADLEPAVQHSASRGSVSLELDVDLDDLAESSAHEIDDVESVTRKIEQLIFEAEQLKVSEAENAKRDAVKASGSGIGVSAGKGVQRQRQRRFSRREEGPKSSRFTEMDGKYVQDAVAVVATTDETTWSSTLATTRPSDVFSTMVIKRPVMVMTDKKRRVSFEGHIGSKFKATAQSKADLEARAHNTMMTKIMQNKEVEEGSSKQLKGLGNFQAQLLKGRSGVKTLRKRLEDEIELQRTVQGGVSLSATRRLKDRTLSSAECTLDSALGVVGGGVGLGVDVGPDSGFRRHSVSSGADPSDIVPLSSGETLRTAPDMTVYQPSFENDPDSYTAGNDNRNGNGTVPQPITRPATANCTASGALTGDKQKSNMVKSKSLRNLAPSPRIVSSLFSPSAAHARRGNKGCNQFEAPGSGAKTPGIRPVSSKFKLIRELADLARKQTSISAQGPLSPEVPGGFGTGTATGPGNGVGAAIPLPAATGDSGVQGPGSGSALGGTGTRPCSGQRRPLSCPSSRPSPSKPPPLIAEMSINRADNALWKKEREKEWEREREKERERESVVAAENTGIPVRTMTARVIEDRKKYQFWAKIVHIIALKDLMSVRVSEQLEEERNKVIALRRAAADRIGECYLRYFRRRMNRLMAVLWRDHKSTRRPLRLMVEHTQHTLLIYLFCCSALYSTASHYPPHHCTNLYSFSHLSLTLSFSLSLSDSYVAAAAVSSAHKSIYRSLHQVHESRGETTQYCNALYCTALRYIVLHCTLLYYTLLSSYHVPSPIPSPAPSLSNAIYFHPCSSSLTSPLSLPPFPVPSHPYSFCLIFFPSPVPTPLRCIPSHVPSLQVPAFYIVRYMRACKRIQRNIRSFLQCKRARVLCVLQVWEGMELHLIKVYLASFSLIFLSSSPCISSSLLVLLFSVHSIKSITLSAFSYEPFSAASPSPSSYISLLLNLLHNSPLYVSFIAPSIIS